MLAGKVAAITGGASGIGAATARLFVREGARVLISDVQGDKGSKLAAELGPSAASVPCDVTQEADIEAMVAAAVNTFGRLDIMVANAGYAGRNLGSENLIERLDAAGQFDRQLAVNLRGAVLCIKHAARAMKLNEGPRGGVILTTASIAGLMSNCASGGGPPVYISAGYAASKRGLIAATELAACELAPYHIRCNAVAPGYVATGMVGEVLCGDADAPQADVEATLAQMSPLRGQAIVPADISNAFLYLSSDMGRAVNGHTLVVDCGMVAGVTGIVQGVEAAPAGAGGVAE